MRDKDGVRAAPWPRRFAVACPNVAFTVAFVLELFQVVTFSLLLVELFIAQIPVSGELGVPVWLLLATVPALGSFAFTISAFEENPENPTWRERVLTAVYWPAPPLLLLGFVYEYIYLPWIAL